MNLSNGVGTPLRLTDEVKERILCAVPEVIVQNQVAYRAKVPKSSLDRWLKNGKHDSELGINSIFSQLWEEYNRLRTDVIVESLQTLRSCPKNYQALTWILEKCFREDFGAESVELKELKLLFMKILPLLGKGESHHASEETKELDSESHQTSGCLT